MKKTLSVLVFAFCAVVLTHDRDASATASFWSAPGVGCIPADNAAGNYSVAAAEVTVTSTSAIDFYCPIPNTGGTNPTLYRINFYSSVLTDASNYVQESLWRKSIGTGTLTQVGSTIGGSGWSAGTWNVTDTFTHTFDFTTYFYYTRVRLCRAGTNTVKFYGAALES